MKEYILSYKEAELYQEIGTNYSEINLEGMYIIKAEKSQTHPYGIHDNLGLQPIPRTKAIEKFKEKIDKHLHAMESGENVEDILEMKDYQREHTDLLQWESDIAFDGGGDFYDEID